MESFSAAGKTVRLFQSDTPGAPEICLNTFSDEGERVMAAARAAGCPPFTLIAISGLDWNREMCPWDCPPPFKKSPPCTGGAGAYLRPSDRQHPAAAEERLSAPPRWRGIAGYSLAGLFAVLPSAGPTSSCGQQHLGLPLVPRHPEYLFSHPPKRRPDRLYFSLGDRESKTRNPLLSQVEQNTAELARFYREQGIETVFQLNPGGHADHPAERTAAGPVLAPAAVRGERAVSPGGQIFPQKMRIKRRGQGAVSCLRFFCLP